MHSVVSHIKVAVVNENITNLVQGMETSYPGDGGSAIWVAPPFIENPYWATPTGINTTNVSTLTTGGGLEVGNLLYISGNSWPDYAAPGLSGSLPGLLLGANNTTCDFTHFTDATHAVNWYWLSTTEYQLRFLSATDLSGAAIFDATGSSAGVTGITLGGGVAPVIASIITLTNGIGSVSTNSLAATCLNTSTTAITNKTSVNVQVLFTVSTGTIGIFNNAKVYLGGQSSVSETAHWILQPGGYITNTASSLTVNAVGAF